MQALAAGRVGWTVRGNTARSFDSQAVQGFRELLPAAEENVRGRSLSPGPGGL